VPAFIFDLDGTLVDSVYQHVFAWQFALRECGMDLELWRIHRKIGMSGGLLLRALSDEVGRPFDEPMRKRLEQFHAEEFARLRSRIKAFPEVNELLATLKREKIPYAIATSGDLQDVQPLIDLLELPGGVPIISKKDAANPKPDPTLFMKAAEQLNSRSEDTLVVGDSVWDMLAARRAHFLGIGLLTGGYGESEMTAAGAFRVFADPAQMRRHLYEAGIP
jgi:HAD superfamily hydrolase (TIGR01549 family)